MDVIYKEKAASSTDHVKDHVVRLMPKPKKKKSLAVFFSDIQDQCWALVLTPPQTKPHTSSLLMGTEGCKRLPISLRYSKRSASSFTLSLSIFSIASSTNKRTFLIWVTVRAWHRTKKMQTSLLDLFAILQTVMLCRQKRVQSVIPTELQP